MPFNSNYCIFNIHIHTGSKIIAISFMLLFLAAIINYFVNFPKYVDFYKSVLRELGFKYVEVDVQWFFVIGLIIHFLFFLTYVSLLYGNIQKERAFYVPFMGLYSIISFVLLLIAAISFVLMIYWIVRIAMIPVGGMNGMLLFLPIFQFILFILSLNFGLLHLYFVNVTYRDYKMLNMDELELSQEYQLVNNGLQVE